MLRAMWTSLLTLWLLYVAVMLAPGANLLLVSQLAASNQARSAQWAGMGVAVGAGLWALLAAVGLAQLTQAVPALRVGLALAGALYLLKLAHGLWTAGLPKGAVQAAGMSRRQAFQRGLLTNMSNIKAAAFFASVFAGALPAEAGPAWQAAAVACVAGTAALWYSLLAHGLSRPPIQRAYARASRVLSRAGALAMLGMATGLILNALPSPLFQP